MELILNLSNFDFNLPENLIAQVPVPDRNNSRLMVVDRNSKSIQEDYFYNLNKYLNPTYTLVFNNTKVMPAKLFGKKAGSEKVFEVLLVKETQNGVWESLIKGIKKLNEGASLYFANGKIEAKLTSKVQGRGILQFPSKKSVDELLEQFGDMPLPPYVKREPNNQYFDLDRERYQTVYAQEIGAIAAPTAGLHFTQKQIEQLKEDKIKTAFVTLHVGPGTFQPIREENILLHKMEKEKYIISQKAWNQLLLSKENKNNILAVGTTATRVLESVDLKGNPSQNIFSGWTNLFIYPGYNFKNVNKLLTNFHLPKSTLFMLVCAFGGEHLIKQAYKTAIERKFRFFSYGDAMLIL
jgi:S-adenosylmethionine:tRNA ribosyltransferase-isomerase